MAVNRISLRPQTTAIIVLTFTLLASWAWFSIRGERALESAQAGAAATTPRGLQDPYRSEAVRNTLRKQTTEIQQLWNAHLSKHPQQSAGVIEMDWQINPDGTVTDVGVVHTDFPDSALNPQLQTLLSKLRYPPPPSGKATYIAHKFNFKKENAS